MSTPSVGQLLDHPAQKDAIHIAIVSVQAGECLHPGTHVGFQHITKEWRTEYVVTKTGEHIGIIDPFLPNPVKEGERCYLFLYPNTVTSLRHEWTHPSFPDPKEVSKTWIKTYAEGIGLTYDKLINATQEYLLTGDYLNEGYLLDGVSLSWEYWDHFERAQEWHVPDENRRSFFTCSC